MRKVLKQTLAEADLVDVWIYTHGRWGEAQADRYFDELETGINRLVRNPEFGHACDQIRQGYRVLRVNRYLIFYTYDEFAVRIVRVLHDRMDPARRL
jgi:toxin ParE1/3/4